MKILTPGVNVRISVCLLLLWGSVSRSFGVGITFTHSGIGSGSIGGVPFANASFSITELADTSNRLPFAGGFSIDDTSATISISGLGLFHFTTPTRTFVNNNLGLVGFSRATIFGTDLFNGPTAGVFASWDMLSAIGPITGPGALLAWSFSPVVTDGGTLIFNNSTPNATFQATVIPEPSVSALCLLVLAAFRPGQRNEFNRRASMAKP